jgi:ATP-dependent helicase HrpB
MANGRGVFVDAADALAREPWLAIAELGGGAARDRILLAAPLDPAELKVAFAGRLRAEDRLVETASGAVRSQRVLRLGELVVEEGPLQAPPPELLKRVLLDQVRRDGLASLAWGEAAAALRARVGFLKTHDRAAADPALWPDLSDPGLMASLEAWLAPLMDGRPGLADISPGALHEALRGLIPWDLQRILDERAPPRWTAPTGASVPIDYAAEGGPSVEIRVQELFGLATHPALPVGVPLALVLLSPARRPIQLTRDLPRFWTGSWREIRKEMRGRYPKHPWPEDPLAAPPTTRAKPRA